jgi:LPS export ABC transporter protein LptC
MAHLLEIKNIKKILLLGILGVMAFGAGLYTFRTQKPSPPPQVLNPGGDSGQVGMEEIDFVQVKDGVKLWELKAESVEYQQTQNLVSFKKVSLTYFPKKDNSIHLVGNLGKLDTKTKNIFMEGEVVISTPDGYELKVPSLYYQDDKREVTTEGMVSLKGPAISLDGQGLTMNLDSQRVWIHNKVKVTLYRSFFNS